MSSLFQQILNPFCNFRNCPVMGSLLFKHFICHQIRHTFQKHHTSGRQFHIFEPCIALNCLETFSCTHLLVSLDPFMALFIKRVHGRYVNPLCIPERKHPVFRKSRFSAPAPPCHKRQHYFNSSYCSTWISSKVLIE